MAVKLVKAVKRELVYADRGKVFIVALEPGDIVTFREKGKRTKYSISLHNVKLLAVASFLSENYQRKLDEYNRKKKAGYTRIRKPRKPSFNIFSKLYQEALNYQRK